MPESIGRLIGSVRKRWLTVTGLRALGRAAGAAAAALALAAGLERWLAPRGDWLLAIAAITLGAIAAAAVLALRALRWPDDRRIARFVEERCPELEDRLATAVTLEADAGVAGLVRAEAAARARDVDPARVVAPAALHRAGWRAAAAMAAFVAAGVIAWPTIERVWLTGWLRLFPNAIELVVEPGDARLRVGQPLRIRARLRGAPPALARQSPDVIVGRGGERRMLRMAVDGDGHSVDVNAVDRSFVYFVTAAGIRSREYTVTALRPPRVARIDLRYEYPAFTGLPARTEVDSGDVYAPAGTRVHLLVRTDRPVASAALTLRGDKRVELRAAPSADVQMEGTIVVERDDAYRVALADAEGLASAGETEYFVRVMDDRPPDVRVLRPGGDRQATPLEEVLVEARAEDDYRIGAFELVFAVRGAKEQVVSIGRGGASAETASHIVYLEELDVKPGDFVSYYARARDVGRGSRNREARSEMFFIEVAPFDQEFSRAQSQAMAGAGGGAGAGLEALIAAQKDIINATWNLERRSRAGRSEQDVRAVGKAQGELRGRAESLAGRLRFAARMGGGRRRPPVEPPQDDPIGRAIEAMKRAETSLDALNTSEAMPHEMAALNELLKADAEIRRRQVTQQMASGGGGGGAGRTGQDLSALFDRELQRQQQTNYESRDTSERRDEETESDALAKVRELARRQDELARKQRELASAALAEEELKRQLERLTREQTELREQAERLEQELARSRQQNGQNGQQRSLRDALDEMRGATSDLRRQDLTGASARGDRAAEKLRESERRMRGQNPDERRRALGELQVETQQLAAAERRVADETARLGRDAADAAARKRLADEQDRLAGRVASLEKQLKEMGSTGQGQERQAAADASRELARRDVSGRLKESAEGLRQDPQPGDRRAGERGQTERELARSLDRVAERMGAPGNADERRLAEAMARAREQRDRLGDLARQIERLQQEERRAAQNASRGRDQSGRQQGGQQQGGQQQGGRQQGGEQQRGQATQGGGAGSGELARLQEEYQRELERSRELVRDLQRSNPDSGLGGSTPEEHEYSTSAPGTQAFKNDFSAWERLRRDVSNALERQEAKLAEKLAGRRSQDRLAAGAADGVPEQYRDSVAKYFESIARTAARGSPAVLKKP